MSLPLIIRPEADDDIQQVYEHMAETRPGLGVQFLSRLGEVFDRIETTPELYGRVWQDIRAARLRKFRHIVYYVVFDDRAEVLAVMHGARNPSTWRLRR